MNTTIKAKNRILSLALALCLALTMTLYLPGPVEVRAADVDIGTEDDLTVDVTGSTLVYFGHNHMQNKDWQGTTDADPSHSPIAWRVVYDNGDGTLTLLSDKLLASRPYDSTNNHNLWNGSEIAGYLNGDFLNDSFDTREAVAMVAQYSTDEESGFHSTDAFTPNETIVLPSVAEVDGNWFINNSERVAYNLSNSSDDWWLRSPGIDPNYAAFVDYRGNVDPGDGITGHGVTRPDGIRPAFRLNLSSVLFTSDASGASPKSGATVGSSLSSVPSAPTGAVKLTVLDDDNLQLTTTDTENRTVREGDTVSINYSNAATGQDTFVSCVIVDKSSGDITHYGKLADTAEGVAAFTVPTGIGTGNYTIRLFNEECHDDKETDYASTPKDIAMQVLASGSDANLSVTAPTFGNETVGYTQPAAQPITIENTGDVDAAITDVTLSGANPTDFAIVEGDSTVPANDSINTWTVRPNANLAVGQYEADIVVTYENGSPSPATASATVSFEVEATTTLSVSNINFGTEQENYAQPTAQPIKITNNGAADATVTGITLAGSNPNDFEITVGDSAPFTVNSGGYNDTWTVQPKGNLTVGPYTASIEVEYTVGSNPTDTATATVEFEVAPATVPVAASLSVQGHDFGTLSLGYSQPASAPIAITNNGDVDGTITDVTLSGNNPGAFLLEDTVTGNNTVTANGGTNTTWTVQPDADLPEGTYTATVTVTYTGGPNASDTATATVWFKVEDGGGDPGPVDPDKPGPDPGGNGSSGSRSRSSSGGSSTPDSQVAKTQLPASAFRWDGDRTLTIDHERITPLGLLSVQWDGTALTRGADYSVYEGSVIVRFGEDFIAAQATGDHTVRVEFLNHTGETTVTVGQTAATEESAGHPDNDTHNPNTGGYPDGSYPGATDNPNTGDGRGIWPALLLGSLGAAALVKLRPSLRIKN